MAFGDLPGRETVVTLARKRKAATARTATSGVSATVRRRVSGLFKEAKALYAPGGEYMKGIEAQLVRGQKKAVATGMQALAGAGLAGTSMAGGLGLRYEEEVGVPTRARATTERLGALAGLLQAEAGATASLATRYATTPAPVARGGGAAAPGFPVRRTPRPTAAPTPAAKKLPTLSAFPSLTGAVKKEPTGYRGIFYGAEYYKRQRQPQTTPVPSASSLMQQADPYNISGYF